MKSILVICACLFLIGCTDSNKAIKTLSQQGYTEIQITGWRPFMKSKKDWSSTGFKAKSISGHYVSGAVTAGIFKGATIRFD